MDMSRQIFLDMDQVIVDLPCPIEVTPVELLAFYRGGLNRSRQEVWGDVTAEWWFNLPWTKDGREILAICERWVGKENVVLCSYACDSHSAEGKIRWIEREMPDYKSRYILTPQKYRCASPRSLLLDDSDRNVTEFRTAGGAAVLCPRLWNENSKFFDHSVQYINALLEEMTS